MRPGHRAPGLCEHVCRPLESLFADDQAQGLFHKIVHARGTDERIRSLENVEMGEALMALFPADEGSVNVALVKADGYQPSAEGALIYLSAGEDLQVVLDRIEEAGGRILLQKTEISPEMGFLAQFSDSEGNRMGLHPPQ